VAETQFCHTQADCCQRLVLWAHASDPVAAGFAHRRGYSKSKWLPEYPASPKHEPNPSQFSTREGYTIRASVMWTNIQTQLVS